MPLNYHARYSSWTPTDGEVTLFQTQVNTTCHSVACIDSSITAQINEESSYNTYRLYIDGDQVAQAGYEGDFSILGPNLETSILIWGKSVKFQNKMNVRVTAQINGSSSSSSNISTTSGDFQDTKGAFLRILLI